MPGAPLELHEREEIFRALIEDPEMSWAEMARHEARLVGDVCAYSRRHAVSSRVLSSSIGTLGTFTSPDSPLRARIRWPP